MDIIFIEKTHSILNNLTPISIRIDNFYYDRTYVSGCNINNQITYFYQDKQTKKYYLLYLKIIIKYYLTAISLMMKN